MSVSQRFIFFYPTISREVESIIGLLKTHKAHNFLNVETKFLKYSKSIIFPTLSDIYNICFSMVVFLNSLNIAEIIPISYIKKVIFVNQLIIALS